MDYFHTLTIKSNMSSFDKLLAYDILNVLGINDTSIGLDAQKSRLAVGRLNRLELPTSNMSNPVTQGSALNFTVSDIYANIRKPKYIRSLA
jgi:hypothetical protein